MPIRRESLGLLAICVLFVVLSLAGLAAAFLTRLTTNVDGLLLIIICLMMGGLFSLTLLQLAKEQGWLPSRKKKQADPAAPAANPAAAKSPATKSGAGT